MLSFSFDALLLDIEGTITSISFVKDVLLTYCRQNLSDYLNTNFDTDLLNGDIDELRKLAQSERSGGDNNVVVIPDAITNKNESQNEGTICTNKSEIIEAIITNVNHWMDLDKKVTALKLLQGHMWREAYNNGSIHGHIYPDVLPFLLEMVSLGIKIYIYSSGSVEAQQLILGHSIEGDLTGLLSGYFDTNIGLKVESSSYSKIADQIDILPEHILFLTDVEKEARAARLANFQSVLVVRDGNAPLSDDALQDFTIIHTFKEIFLPHSP